MRVKLVQKLQMPCEVKCAPGVQDGCQKRISWLRRERCRCSWCSLHVIGDLEAVITLVAVSGPLCIGSSTRGKCNIDDGVRRCGAHCMCSIRWRSGDRDSCKVSFVRASLMMPVIMLPCVSALVALTGIHPNCAFICTLSSAPFWASDKEKKKALVECPINVHETP